MSYSGGTDATVIPLHLGALHPAETLAMTVLALGPLVMLAVVVTIVSRRDRRAEADEAAQAWDPRGDGGQATREDCAAGGDIATTTDTAAPHSVQQ